MPLKWYTTVIDCADLHAQARWWAGVLDWQLIYEADDEAVIVPKHVEDRPLSAAEWLSVGPGLIFVRVPEGKTVKNRLHLDLAPHITDDRDARIESLLAGGATRVDVGQDESMVSWTVLADPEGNEFCVLSARDRLPTSGHGVQRSSPRSLATKTNLQTRSGGHIAQDGPSWSVRCADIPKSSNRGRCCPPPRQQVRQQSRWAHILTIESLHCHAVHRWLVQPEKWR